MTEGNQIPEAISRMLLVLSRFRTEKSGTQGFNFKPEPNDVIISTAPKSGTTLVQQICHGLRSGGDMSFGEIDEVIPCIESAYDCLYGDLNAPQSFQPRMYKTHFWYHDTPKGAEKKPADIALSFYYYCENWLFSKNEVSVAELTKFIWLKLGAPKNYQEFCSAFHHIISWYPHRLDENVLWLHYEDLNKNRRECVRLISEFLNIGVDDKELQELVTKQSSIEFMKKHSTQFNDRPFKHGRNEAVGLAKEAGMSGNPGKVRNGISNSAKDVLPQSVIDQIDAQWNEVVTSVTGYSTYEEFRTGINKELNRKFS
eukprot:g5048.t1